MKSVSKKIISFVLAAVMMLSCAVVAFAEGEEIKYMVDPLEDESFVISGIEDAVAGDGILTIPTSITRESFGETYTIAVSEIGEYAYNLGVYESDSPVVPFLEGITELVISAGIKKVGGYAFMDMPALTKVTFEGDVEIGDSAFQNCPLLETVVFKGSADIGENAFKECPNAIFETTEGKVYDAPKSAVEGTKWYDEYPVDFVTLGTTLIQYKGKDEEEVLPENITVIGKSAFAGNTTLKKVVLNKYIDTIGDEAFKGCSALTEVVFSDYAEIKNIGKDVFVDTPYFDDFQGEFFTIGNTLIKYLGEDVDHVTIPKTITAIAPYAFDGCYKTNEKDEISFVISSILVPASVTDLGEDCLKLAVFADGESYAPRIYAYEGTPVIKLLRDAGYLVTPLNNKKGDLNNDGKITAADARLALRLSVGLDEATDSLVYAGDLDGDGAVTAADARILLRISVGLEDYTIDDLMNIPTTKFEVISTYANALKQASKYNLGYYKKVSNTITGSDICNVHSKKLLAVAEKNSVNQTYKYLKNNQVAIDALPKLTIQDTSLIKNAKCVAVDGKYHVTIKFFDVQNCYLTVDDQEYKGSAPYFASMIPTVTGDVFYNAISANKWFGKFVADDDNLTANCVRKYALTYTNPTVNAIIDIKTGKPEYIELKVGYHFAVDGRVNGLDISSEGFKTGDATIDRLDSVVYSDFY